MMTKEQFDKLMQYIDIRIKELIEEDNRRDSLHESVRRYEIQKELADMLITKDNQ